MGLYLPTSQALQEEALLKDHVPSGQVMHARIEVLPVLGLYLPALQGVQEREPLEDHVPTGQVTHALTSVLLLEGLYVPASQGCSAVPNPHQVPGLQGLQVEVREPAQQPVHVVPGLHFSQPNALPRSPGLHSPAPHSAADRVAKRMSRNSNNACNVKARIFYFSRGDDGSASPVCESTGNKALQKKPPCKQ